MRISIIIPAHNAAEHLPHGLAALLPQMNPEDECIVVNDASSDQTQTVAGATHRIELPRRSGPAAARNAGAAQASGDILVFLDADVVPHADLLKRMRVHFLADPELAALFGAYDDSPLASAAVSRFRNLLHCYTHRTANTEASTFWAGCGAIRKNVFHAFGGFDENRYPSPSMEDIELGVRLRSAGKKILLDPELQAQHRKLWTLGRMIRTDIFGRAIPWTTLILESRRLPADLNLKLSQRWSAAAVGASALLILFTAASWVAPATSAVLLAFTTVLNLPFYRFLAQRGGWWFAIRSIPLHWVYFLSGIAGSVVGAASYLASRTIGRVKVERTNETRP